MEPPPPAESPPPAYEASASPNTNTDQTRWPSSTALLPGYSTSSPSCWMKNEGTALLQTSHDFDAIRLICKFVPGLDDDVATALLSKRRKDWLDAFLKVLYQHHAIQELSYDSPQSTANAIVRIIRRRQFFHVPELDGVLFFSALSSPEDVSVIADQLDAQILKVFSMITWRDWLEWYYGFPNDLTQSLLNGALNLRNTLTQFVQNDARMLDRLQSLHEASFYSCTRYITNIENRYCDLHTLYYNG